MATSRPNYDDFDYFVGKCQKFVDTIESYSGDDPLGPWYNYLLWIEENYVIDFKTETIFDLILAACLCQFEQDERYKQDRRLIKLFIKFVHFQEEQEMHYKTMLANGIGEKVADLYINWAFYFHLNGDLKKADQIFKLGISAKAEPLHLLEKAHESFGNIMSRRILYKSNAAIQGEIAREMQKQLEEITALRLTETSIKVDKSLALIRNAFEKRAQMIPFHTIPKTSPESQHHTSIAQNIIDSARKMRREKRQSANQRQGGCRLNFGDSPSVPEQNSYEHGIRLSKNFVRKNLPQSQPPSRAYVDPYIGVYRKTLPGYDKLMLVPANNVAFSPDELKAYNWFKQRRISNAFTKEQDKIWGIGYDVPIRYADVFARANFPQSEWIIPRISPSEECNERGPHRFMCNMAELYPRHTEEEYQLEEIMWQKRKKSIQTSVVSHVQANKSVLKPGRIQNRTISSDSKLSPIIEMDLSGCGDDMILDPRKRECVQSSVTKAAINKKRKSSFVPVFDALNDTCTTQMFGNLLRNTAISTPKAKMPKFDIDDSIAETLKDKSKFKLYVDESTADLAPNTTTEKDFSKETNKNAFSPNPPNEFKFAIYEDTTTLTTEIKNIARKQAANDTIGNKENVLATENRLDKIEPSKTQSKAEIRGCESALATSTAKRNEICTKDVRPEAQNQIDESQPPNSIAFDICKAAPQTENLAKDCTENRDKISKRAVEVKESLRKDSAVSMRIESTADITKSAKSIANQKVDQNGESNAVESSVINAITGWNETANEKPQSNIGAFDIYKDQTTQFLDNVRDIFGIRENKKDKTDENGNKTLQEEIERMNDMVKSIMNATKSDKSDAKDQSLFKDPSIANLSIRKIDVKKPNQTTFCELLDTTEEFEALEAQCAKSPPAELSTFTSIKNVEQSLAKCVITPKKAATNKTKEGSLLNWTLQRCLTMSKEKEQTVDEHASNENKKNDDEEIGKSIYVEQPELQFHEKDADWHEVTQFLSDATSTNEYKVEEVNLDETRQRIDTHMLNLQDLNPFDPEVQKDVLADLGFFDQLNGANNFNCIMMNIVQPLKPRSSIEINKRKYQIRKLIGTGAYGRVFSAECTNTKKWFAFKQQRPPNLWEYYVCLQAHARIKDESVRKGIMSVDFAVIGNNATIYASTFSKYGTLLNVCNTVKQVTNKNIEECIVMILVKQMFTIMETFHKANFIHADVKPDNFLLMDKLSLNYENPDIVLQLIDFGQSIDLNYFKNYVFWAKVKTENFVCTEMMENKPWTFHCDFFCLASTIYTMVAGKYMVVSRRKVAHPYKPQKLPRYVNSRLWDEIFETLINIPSIRTMPSLSKLQQLLDAELQAIGPKKVTDAIIRFNKALD